MSAPTTVVRVDVVPLEVALREPFGIAGGTQARARNLLVTVELADRTLGYGEAAPLPAYNGETQEAALASLERARQAIVGMDARRWRGIAATLAKLDLAGSARCATETALLDALTKRSRLSLWAFFGGAEDTLTTDMTIPTGTADRARRAARRLEQEGYRTIKVKVGGAAVDDDVERLRIIAREAPSARLVIDANASLTAEQALSLVQAARRVGVPLALFEQPVTKDDLAGLARVTAEAGVLVAADESVVTAQDALRIVEARAAHVLNVKLMKGGVVAALEIAAVARAAGLGLMIGGMVETILAMSTSACFAAGLGGFDFVDLDTPQFLAENPFTGGYVQAGEELCLSAMAAGHGVAPR